MAFCVSMDPHLCSICLFIRLSFDFPMCTPDSSAAQKIMYPISSISFFGCISVQGQNLADPASEILVRQLERGRCKIRGKTFDFFILVGPNFFRHVLPFKISECPLVGNHLPCFSRSFKTHGQHAKKTPLCTVSSK